MSLMTYNSGTDMLDSLERRSMMESHKRNYTPCCVGLGCGNLNDQMSFLVVKNNEWHQPEG